MSSAKSHARFINDPAAHEPSMMLPTVEKTEVMASERLRLRRLAVEDTEAFDRLNRDTDVMKYLDRHAPTLEDVRRGIQESIDTSSKYSQLGQWPAETPEGEFVGWFALMPYAEETGLPIKVLEIGYRLHHRFWGQGLATEGCRLLLRRAFSTPEAEEVVGTTMFVNDRSRRVMEKAGLRLRKVYHEHFDDPLPGTEHGEVIYGISRAEWETIGK